jgi:HPt (histidine-containing phosphotransfer) domain-containing protein
MIINEDVLNDLKEIMEDDFNELISIFISDGVEQIKELDTAVHLKNHADIKRIAHTLKGSCANIGAFKLSETCKQLEYILAENSLAGVIELQKKIALEFDETRKCLEDII